MDDAVFNRLLARAADRRLVPGIYNYCDRRCDHCRFTTRCLSFLDTREEAARERAAAVNPDDHVPRSASSIATDAVRGLHRALQMMRLIAERHGVDVEGTPEEREAYERDTVERDRRAREDPAVALSRHYAMTAWPITRALWPIVMPRGDRALIEALETIEALCTLVSSKTYRAVTGALEPDDDPTDLQGDPNGSAKTARLLIADSRRAWSVLMEAGRATADGVPAKLVAMLDELDAAVAARFPHAMAFVRPGFDTEPPSTMEDDQDPALAVLPQGHA